MTERSNLSQTGKSVVAGKTTAAGMAPFGYCGGVVTAERLRTHGVTLFAEMAELPALLDAPSPASPT